MTWRARTEWDKVDSTVAGKKLSASEAARIVYEIQRRIWTGQVEPPASASWLLAGRVPASAVRITQTGIADDTWLQYRIRATHPTEGTSDWLEGNRALTFDPCEGVHVSDDLNVTMQPGGSQLLFVFGSGFTSAPTVTRVSGPSWATIRKFPTANPGDATIGVQLRPPHNAVAAEYVLVIDIEAGTCKRTVNVNVTVARETCPSITVNAPTITVNPGGDVSRRASVAGLNNPTWSISGVTWATVDQSGNVRARPGAGVATGTYRYSLTATGGLCSDSGDGTIRVVAVVDPCAGKSVNAPNITVAAGASAFAVATQSGLGSSPSWARSSGPSWVVVDTSTGRVTAMPPRGTQAGNYRYTVSGTDGSCTVSDSGTITVTGPSVTQAPGPIGLKVTVTSASLTADITAPTTGGTPSGYRIEVSRNSNYSAAEVFDVDEDGAHTVTGLLPDTDYYVRARATNAIGNGPWASRLVTTEPLPTVAPGPPGFVLSATDVTVSGALSRGAGGFPDSYRVEITATRGVWTGARNQTVTGGTVTFDALTPETTYYLRARASNTAGNSIWVERSITTEPQVVVPEPPGPQRLSLASEIRSVRATVARGTGGTPTSYRFELSTSSDYSSPTVRGRSTPGSVTFDGLTPDTLYYVRARASNSHGTGPWANDSIRTKSAVATKPGEPRFTVAGITHAELTASVFPSAGGLPTSYRIELSENSDYSDATVQTGSSAFSYTFRNLKHLTTYYLRARASNAGGDSPWAERIASTRDLPSVAPGAPGLILSFTHNTAVATVSAGTGGIPTGYRIELSPNSDYSGATASELSAEGSSEFTGLTPETEYYVRARATNAAGPSPWTNRHGITEPEPDAPDLPSPPTMSTSSTRASVAVTVGRGVGGGDPDRYTVQLSASDDYSSPSILGRSTAGTVTFSGLSPGTRYYVRARAVNSDGNSAWTQATEDTKPNTPPRVTITTRDQIVDGGDVVVLTGSATDPDGRIARTVWTASPDAGRFGHILFPTTTWTAPAAKATEESYLLTLTATDNDGGTGSSSVRITVRAIGSTHPPVWSPIPDAEVGDGTSVSYDLRTYVDDLDTPDASLRFSASVDFGSEEFTASVSGHTLTITGTGSEALGSVTVSARDGDGNSASTQVTVSSIQE